MKRGCLLGKDVTNRSYMQMDIFAALLILHLEVYEEVPCC